MLSAREKQILSIDIERCKQLIDTGVLERDSVFSESVFTEVMIRLKDVLGYLREKGMAPSWNDHVAEGTIVDLIFFMRNAACHIRSGNRSLMKSGKGNVAFNVFFGKQGMEINGITVESKFDDDIAFNYGPQLIYLHRHIYRLINEVATLLSH